jgi:hypothetical protein
MQVLRITQKNIQITASIIDFGFIKHSKVESLTLKGSYKYEGVTPSFSSEVL